MVQKQEGRSRGRPRRYDPAAALAAARDAFWDAGFPATSLDDLARATGMNRPSLYAAFGDKRAMYLTILRQQAAGMVAATTLAMGLPGGLRAVMETFYVRAVGIYVGEDDAHRGCFLIGTALTEATHDAEVREILQAAFAGMDDLLRGRFEKAVADGDLPKDSDVAALAFVAISSLHGLAIRARAGVDRATLESWARAAASVVCGAP
ncbi:MAG: TetR/AcrR family transcriptional regulator [Pseudomonadota bacterium]